MHYREYVRATGISLLFTFCMYLYFPILSPYIKSIGLDDFQVGLVFAIVPLVIIFSSPIIGRLSDEVGRIWVIIIGLILEIAAMAFYLIGTHWAIIIIARILDAVAIVAVSVVVLAKIQDALTDKERGKYSGWSLSLGQIGAIVAPVVGGVLADKLFVKAPFILTAVLLLVMTFIIVFRTNKPSKKVTKTSFNLVKEIKSFLSVRQLKGMAVLGIVMHATTPATMVFLPLFIVEKLGLSYSYVGVALFFLGVAHVFQFYFGTLADKFGRGNMVMFGCFIYALFLFILSTTNQYWLILIILLLQGVGGAMWNVSAWSLMSDIGEKMKKEGAVIGSYMSLAKIGGFISFVFSGLVVQIFSIQALFMIDAFIVAVGMLLASFYLKEKHVFSEKTAKHL